MYKAFDVWLLYVFGGFLTWFAASLQCKRYRRERRRLNDAIRAYNRRCKDDYDFFTK